MTSLQSNVCLGFTNSSILCSLLCVSGEDWQASYTQFQKRYPDDGCYVSLDISILVLHNPKLTIAG